MGKEGKRSTEGGGGGKKKKTISNQRGGTNCGRTRGPLIKQLTFLYNKEK